jgi:hypothetical protein
LQCKLWYEEVALQIGADFLCDLFIVCLIHKIRSLILQGVLVLCFLVHILALVDVLQSGSFSDIHVIALVDVLQSFFWSS